MTGLGVIVRAYARRDRWFVGWFALGTTLLYWSQAVSVDGLYPDQAAFDRAAASMADNTAFIVMTGPARALNTTGGQVAWQSTAFGAIVVGLMAMFLVGRHTRAEEESGRDELIRSGVVGRTTTTVAALIVATAASTLVGVAVSASLLAYGLPTAGSLIMGVGLAGFGAAAAGTTALACQLVSSTRAAYGLTGAVLGASYALRAVGDVAENGLSWASPIGWYQAMHGYSGDRWWPVLLLVAAALLSAAAAGRVFERRDFGSGVVASKPGPAHAAPGLLSPVGLAWRLQRGSVFGWFAGIFLGGLGYGSIGDDVEDLLGDSEFSQEVFAAGGADLVDSFYAVSILMLVLIASGFAISSALHPRSEEDQQRVEALLATALPRRSWLLGHLTVTLAGSVAAVLAGGLGIGVGYALVTGDGAAVARLALATFSQAPGLLVLAGVAVLVYGMLPRRTWIAWLALLFCLVVMLFGEVLQFPSWVEKISPFSHLTAVPAVAVDWSAVVAVGAVGVVLIVVGVLAFERRDLT